MADKSARQGDAEIVENLLRDEAVKGHLFVLSSSFEQGFNGVRASARRDAVSALPSRLGFRVCVL
jgi:hypothetical protein